MKKFNVIEICAGVGGFGLGFEPYGQVLAAVEWDKAAAGVYKYNNPEVEMFCDLTEVRATDLPWDADDLVICGGTPCQAFSIAGLRGSLSDDRGNLALTFNNLCNAIDDLRLNAGKEPAIIIWENVCGAINTDDNAFGCILAGMAGSDAPLVPVGEQRWTNAGVVVGPRRAVSFRVLDSQYFGVAQRRRRVFAVAIGGARKWAAPSALIPFQKSLPRNPKARESSVEGSSGNAGSSATGASRDVAQGADVYNGEITGETAATVTSATGIANASGPKVMAVDTLNHTTGDVNQTLKAASGGKNESLGVVCSWNGDVTPKSSEDVSVTLRSQQGGEGVGVAHETGQGYWQEHEHSGCLRAEGENRPSRPSHVVCSWNGDVTPKASEDVSVTLRSQQGGEGVGVAQGPEGPCYENHPGDSRVTDSGELAPTLTKRNGTGGGNLPFIKDSQNLTVRRLSSVECMRLQGWPDTHCDFKMELELDGNRWKPTGKAVKQAEGPKYKQAGNGVTANVVAYIAGKLMDALSK